MASVDDVKVAETSPREGATALNAAEFERMSLYQVLEAVTERYDGTAIFKKNYSRSGNAPADAFVSEAILGPANLAGACPDCESGGLQPYFTLHGESVILEGTHSLCNWHKNRDEWADVDDRSTANMIRCQQSDGEGGDNNLVIEKSGGRITLTYSNADWGQANGYYVTRRRTPMNGDGYHYNRNDGFSCRTGETQFSTLDLGGSGNVDGPEEEVSVLLDENPDLTEAELRAWAQNQNGYAGEANAHSLDELVQYLKWSRLPQSQRQSNLPNYRLEGCRKLIPLRDGSGAHNVFVFDFNHLFVRQ